MWANIYSFLWILFIQVKYFVFWYLPSNKYHLVNEFGIVHIAQLDQGTTNKDPVRDFLGESSCWLEKYCSILRDSLPAAQEWSILLSGNRCRHKNKQLNVFKQSHLNVLLRELKCRNKRGENNSQKEIQRYFLDMQRYS